MKQIYFSVTNDLVNDQRVHRIISSLMQYGHNLRLIGRKFRNDPVVSKRDYETYRFSMVFSRGFLFYAFFNIRLFLYLLTRKKIDILVANDLDTLPANYLISKLRNTSLVYDSHEYFTETPELVNRRFVRMFWLWIEKMIVPRLKIAYTVSHSIAEEYQKKYGIKFNVIRNLPYSGQIIQFTPLPFDPGDKKILLYQGSLNIGRGLELIIESMEDINDVIFLIAGDGDIRRKLENCVKAGNLSDKVYFLGRIPFEKLQSITIQADGGVSFEEDLGLNYRFALPNKLFDYINAQIPVFVSSLPEMAGIVEKYNIGIIGFERDVNSVRKNIIGLLFDSKKRMVWKRNLVKAAQELSWENEEIFLHNIYSQII